MLETSGAGGGFAHAVVTLAGVPSSYPPNLFYSAATATVTYGIELAGAVGTEVPVVIGSYLSASDVTGDLSDQAILTVTGPLGVIYSKTCYQGACFDSASGGDILPRTSGPVSNGGHSGPAVFTAGYEYTVELQATASAEMNGTAEASVDPTFTVDPAYASSFHLLGVPGVPEPASWALLVSGFAFAGATLRRGRHRHRLLRGREGLNRVPVDSFQPHTPR